MMRFQLNGIEVNIDDANVVIVRDGSITISNQKLESVSLTSGSVVVHGDIGRASTTGGSITVNGNIRGNASATSGEIKAEKIMGKAEVTSGKITII
jgi:hypothetical protein